MAYSKSSPRIDFDKRVDFLLKKSRRAQRLRVNDSDIRDLVFQCAIFSTSAAAETYLRILIETWVQRIKVNNLGQHAPKTARIFIAAKSLEPTFSKYLSNGDEKDLLKLSHPLIFQTTANV